MNYPPDNLTLYKYRSSANEIVHGYTIDILKKKQFYMPIATFLNDPFECRIYFDDIVEDNKVEDLLRKKGKKPAEIALKIKRRKRRKQERISDEWHAMQDMIDIARRDTCILSFSELPDVPLMWSHYSGAFQGVCLGFDPKKCDWMHEVYPINYVNSMPILDYDCYTPGELTDALYLTKASWWGYEKEWRFAQMPQNYGYSKGSVDGIFWRFHASALKEVILGCFMERSRKQEVIEIVNRDFPEAKILFANLDKSTYSVQINENDTLPMHRMRTKWYK